jgi:hypothetical protein
MNGKNQVSKVDAARAYKLAFTAQHAFHDFFFQVKEFSPLNQGMDLPDVQFREMSGCTGCRAASASHAKPDGGLYFIDKVSNTLVVGIKINLTVFADRVPERFHS